MDDFLRRQIKSANDKQYRDAVTARVAGMCWPSGTTDRTEPAAHLWLRQWWPERVGAQLPACSCASGRCPVCN